MSTKTITLTRALGAVGQSIPAHSVHGISVSLPTWQDNIDYEEGDPRVVGKIRSAYPRFKIHYLIERLENICEGRFGKPGEKCRLYPSLRLAEECRSYMHVHSPDPSHPIDVRLAGFWIHPPEAPSSSSGVMSPPSSSARPAVELHVVFFPVEAAALAKSFWQHTGAGISSRLAEYCLSLLCQQVTKLDVKEMVSPPTPTSLRACHRRYSSFQKGTGSEATRPNSSHAAENAAPLGDLDPDWTTYIEERYARNLPVSGAATAKRALRRRIAGVLVPDATSPTHETAPALTHQRGITEDEVYLFSSGMCAIWHAHKTALGTFPPYKSVCFGFPYIDTYKLLQKWGPGCHFFGRGAESDLEELQKTLQTSRDAGSPIRALFCEYPSNPLLRSPPVVKLRKLADEYDFIIVVDETIGSFANLEVLPFADIIVSSLSKVFSGETNVLGGSLVLNPHGRHFAALKSSLDSFYEDNYWIEDAVFMERNSRDFAPRVSKMNKSTEALCDFLYARSLASIASSSSPSHSTPTSHFVIKEVFYPKYTRRELYDECRIGSPQQMARSGNQHRPLDPDEGGYGMLFSVTFVSELASAVFYDALPVEKGPSLGTNFTLASPYCILAHYFELDWAAQFDVEKGLVRVSVGLEDQDFLIACFKGALEKAEEAVRTITSN